MLTGRAGATFKISQRKHVPHAWWASAVAGQHTRSLTYNLLGAGGHAHKFISCSHA